MGITWYRNLQYVSRQILFSDPRLVARLWLYQHCVSEILVRGKLYMPLLDLQVSAHSDRHFSGRGSYGVMGIGFFFVRF